MFFLADNIPPSSASLAACIRLHYTISLTSTDDYLCKFLKRSHHSHPRYQLHPVTNQATPHFTVGVANIVIWGYGEIAVGMFCGCLATLRPLFRKMFRLGSVGSSGVKPAGPSNSPFPQNSRSAYGQLSGKHGGGGDVEMGNLGGGGQPGSSSAFKASVSGSNEMQTEIRASVSSESDSIEQILKETGGMGQSLGSKGIMVNRQVNIVRS